MNKAELIEQVAETTNMTKSDINRAIKAFEQVVSSELSRGGHVLLVGFGKFSVVRRAARPYRHPRTGKIINAPAKKTVGFKAGKDLAEMIS